MDELQLSIENITDKLRVSASSRVHMHNTVKPQYRVHDIYTTKHGVRELERVSGHILEVEEGRWNRRWRGRLPMEERSDYAPVGRYRQRGISLNIALAPQLCANTMVLPALKIGLLKEDITVLYVTYVMLF